MHCCRPRRLRASIAIRRDSVTLPKKALDAVHAGEVDVLVGTQMIAKGHDFQRVSLVVVLNPDGQLASHDFRAPERLFATLMQVSGRAGRAGLPSRVLVQTRFPAHPLFAALARHDYAQFAEAQLAERQAARMPPATHQALMTAEARTMEAALEFLAHSARTGAAAVHRAASHVRLFDPVPMSLQRLAGVSRAQLLIEADQRAQLHTLLGGWLAALREKRTQHCDGISKSIRWSCKRPELRRRYLTAAAMCSTAARNSASLALATAPRGGIAPLPLMTDAVSASMPCPSRGAQAALSPNFGAPATPAAWHTLQPDAYTLAPSTSR